MLVVQYGAELARSKLATTPCRYFTKTGMSLNTKQSIMKAARNTALGQGI